jgi:hypothetical protein
MKKPKPLISEDWDSFAEKEVKKSDFTWLNKRKFDPLISVQTPDPIIKIQGNIIMTEGNYITISGKPKAGKSAFISGAIGAALTGENILGWQISMPKNRPNIIHVDTEQGEFEYYQSVQMIKKLSKLDALPNQFQSFRLRGIKAEQIRQAIEHLAMMDGTGILIIDGLLDTIIDFNDIHECRMITDLLRDITEKQKIGIICIIHQSKSNNFTIGHLGSFADRYSQSVLEVVRDDEAQVSSIKPVYLRSAGKFSPISIQFDVNNQIWKYAIHEPEHHKGKGSDITDEEINNFFAYLFENRTYCTFKMIEDDGIKHFKITRRKVSTIMERMFEMNLIRKDGSNYYQNIPF